MSQYKTVTVTDADGVDHEMLEVQYEDKICNPTGMRSYVCVICGFVFKEDKVSLKGGAAFCHPNECYLDMNTARSG